MEKTIKALICTQTDSRFIRQTDRLISEKRKVTPKAFTLHFSLFINVCG